MGTVIYTRDYQLDELLGEDSPTSTVVLKRSYAYNALEQQGGPHPHQHDAVWLPFGGVHSITGTASNNACFPGQWFQAESDLHYNWHRTYDPTTGRYIKPDPLRLVDGPSVYAYVGSNPQMDVDPEGLGRLRLRRFGWGLYGNYNRFGQPKLDYSVRPSLRSPGGAGPVRLGQAGEAAVRRQCENGPHTMIELPNGNRRRPDGLTRDSLSEVKNCSYVCMSRQLRDYLAFSQGSDRTMNLFTVRPNTRLSRKVQQAIDRGEIRRNPGFKP